MIWQFLRYFLEPLQILRSWIQGQDQIPVRHLIAGFPDIVVQRLQRLLNLTLLAGFKSMGKLLHLINVIGAITVLHLKIYPIVTG